MQRITLQQLEAVWAWIQKEAASGGALHGSMFVRGDDAVVRFWNWAKQLIKKNVIRKLQRSLRRPSKNANSRAAAKVAGAPHKSPFLSVNGINDMKEVVVLTFPELPSNEVDWGDFLDRWMMKWPDSSPQAV